MSNAPPSSGSKGPRLSVLRPPTEEGDDAGRTPSWSAADRQSVADLQSEIDDLVEGFCRVQAKLMQKLTDMTAQCDAARRLLQEHGIVTQPRSLPPYPDSSDDFAQKVRCLLAHPEGIPAEAWDKYRGQWVALNSTGTTVLAASASYADLERSVAQENINPQNVWFMMIPDDEI